MKKSITVTILIFWFFTASSQNKTMMELLQSTAWEWVDQSDPELLSPYPPFSEIPILYVFKNDTLTKYTVNPYTQERLIFEEIFYLSNKLDEEFDSSKLGKEKNGKYLISQSIVVDNFTSYEIINISESELVLKITQMVFGSIQKQCYRPYNGPIE